MITQGEWTICKHATPEYAPQFGIYAGDSRDFCIVKGDKADNAKDNAHLIAAAPKLLEACKGIMNAVCFGDHGHIKDGGYICLSTGSPEIVALYKAVANAEGK